MTVNYFEIQRDRWCGRGEEKGNVNTDRDIEWCMFSAGCHGIKLSAQ
jgi:hypothetical protein